MFFIFTIHNFFKKTLLLVESSVIVIFHMNFLMHCVVIINYLGIFFIKLKKIGVNNCFKPLISFVVTTVASRLKSEQKEKEK